MLKGLTEIDASLLHLYEVFKDPITDKMVSEFKTKNPYFDVEAMEEAYLKKYPLLGCLNSYHSRHSGVEFAKIVCNYVNLLDNQKVLDTSSA